MSSSTNLTSTGEFHASNMGSEANVGCPVVWGSKLIYFTSGSNNDTKIVTCNLSGLQAGTLSSVTSNSNWSKFELEDQLADGNGADFVTNFGTAAVLLGSRLYFFWVDTHSSGKFYAAYLDQFGNYSPCAYRINEQNGSTLSEMTLACNVSANVAPNGTTIAVNWFNTSSLKYHTLVLDPANIDDNNKRWAGTDGSYLLPSNYGLSSVDSSYYQISSAWFTQGSLGNYALASFYSSDDNHVYFLLYPISDDGTPAHTGTSHVFTVDDFDCRRGFFITRDPSGRLYGIQCKDDSGSTNLYCRVFDTYQRVQQDDSGNNPSLRWGSSALLNGSSKDSQEGPSAAFIAGNSIANSSIQLKNSQGQNQNFTCTKIPQYCIVLYADSNKSNSGYDLQVQVAAYGNSYIVPDYSVLSPSSQYSDTRIISMIMDSFPFPNENLGNSVNVNESLIEYAYGASSVMELSATMSVDLLFGVKSSFSTNKGVGPAEESEFKTGPQASLSASTQTSTFTSFAVDTTPVDAPAGFATPYKIESHGEYHGSTLSDIHEDIAIFQDAGGVIVNGSHAPLFSTLRTVRNNNTAAVSGQYATYCYTPGDISSYQAANINQTMAQKYNALSSSQKSFFTPDYATDYINKVIIPNATQLGDNNYLEFTVDGSGHSSNTVEQINQVVATLGWTVQGSLYAGVSGGEELSVFGFGEGFDASLMVGFDYNFSVSGGVSVGSSWGINFDIHVPTNVTGAKGYTVKMYICKPNNLWAREMQFFSGQYSPPSGIDFDNSAPSKIMFVVSNIINTLPPGK